MFIELNHVLVDMLVVLHFQCVECAFGGLCQVGLPKVNIELVYKLTPNQQFWVVNEDGLPPEHGNVREIGSCIQHPLMVCCKLVRSTVKGHDAADDEWE